MLPAASARSQLCWARVSTCGSTKRGSYAGRSLNTRRSPQRLQSVRDASLVQYEFLAALERSQN